MTYKTISKCGDYEIVKGDNNYYYVVNFWDESRELLGEFKSWSDAEAFCALKQGWKPYRELIKKENKCA